MKIHLSILFVCLNISCFSQQVKSLLVTQYFDRDRLSVSIPKDTIQYQEWYSNGHPKSKLDNEMYNGCTEKREYDTLGRILKKAKKCEKYKNDCVVTYDSLLRKEACNNSKFNYILIDSLSYFGKIVTRNYQSFVPNGENHKLSTSKKWKHYYDLNYTLILSEEFSQDKLYVKTNFNYDKHNNLIHKNVQYSDTNQWSNSYFKYDSVNRIVQATNIRSSCTVGLQHYDTMYWTYRNAEKITVDFETKKFNDTLIKQYYTYYLDLLEGIKLSGNIQSFKHVFMSENYYETIIRSRMYEYDKKGRVCNIDALIIRNSIYHQNEIIDEIKIEIDYSKNQTKITEHDLIDPKYINEKITLFKNGKKMEVIEKVNGNEQVITHYNYQFYE